jgi:hypothetical protein
MLVQPKSDKEDVMQLQAKNPLSEALRGHVIQHGDEGYDDACRLYNGMIDKRPAIIARCVDVADVIAAVNYGRDTDMLIAIRGGGHNGPGLGSCDDGLVIDLSPMKGVHVDPRSSTVRVEPGCTQGDVDHATHACGLAVPAGIVSTTGIAGLTLGGGSGYLSRKYGLTIDSLIEADVVLADGRLVTANATENADLFWALRGGGGNFGVVTSFLFKAHPVGTVFGGPIFWEARHAMEVMSAYRDFLPSAPEELGIFVGLKRVLSTDPFPRDHWGADACAIVGCYNGPADQGIAALAPLLDRLPEPIFNWMQELPFPALQSMFDPFFPAGMQWYWKGDFVASLPDEAIEAHIAQAARSPSEFSMMHLYPIDGAVRRVGQDETAWNARKASWSMVIAGVASDPAKAPELKAWATDYWEAVHPFNAKGGYVNFMMDDEGEARVRASYGANYERLAAIKARYDPDNLFRVNQNIKPAN